MRMKDIDRKHTAEERLWRVEPKLNLDPCHVFIRAATSTKEADRSQPTSDKQIDNLRITPNLQKTTRANSWKI